MTEKTIRTPIDKAVAEILETRAKHVEMMTAAYLSSTTIPPEKVDLVEVMSEDRLTVRWFFQEREQ